MIIEKPAGRIENVEKYITKYNFTNENRSCDTKKGSFDVSALEISKTARPHPNKINKKLNTSANTTLGTQTTAFSNMNYDILNKDKFINQQIPTAEGFTNLNDPSKYGVNVVYSENSVTDNIKNKINIEMNSPASLGYSGDSRLGEMKNDYYAKQTNLPKYELDTFRQTYDIEQNVNTLHSLQQRPNAELLSNGYGQVKQNFENNNIRNYDRPMKTLKLQTYDR